MPRDSNGNYVLPAGNPVVSGTIIASGWANPTMSDIGVELTNSLDRQGRGGMLAPFKFLDGTAGAPGMTWTSEPSTGFFRAGASDQRATVAGVGRMRWTGSGVDVWDPTANAGAGAWIALTTGSGTNFAVLNAANKFTVQQTIVGAGLSWQTWEDSGPLIAARFGLGSPGFGEVGFYKDAVGSWISTILFDNEQTYFSNSLAQYFTNADRSVIRARIDLNGLSVGPVAFTGAQAAPAVRMGAAFNGAGYVETGAYSNDGVNNARCGLFAQGDATQFGSVGIDYTYSNGVSGFQFRRVGVPIFNYNEVGINLINGLSFYTYGADNTTYCNFKVDTNGPAYWNSGASLTGYQWYINGAIQASIVPNKLLLSAAAGGSDQLIATPVAGGAISFRGDGSTVNRGLSLGNVDNTGTFTPAFQIGDFVPGVARFLNGLILQVFDSTNARSGGINLVANSIARTMQYVDNGAQRGGMLFHYDSALTYGGIFVSASAAPATGGTPGQIWLQTE